MDVWKRARNARREVLDETIDEMEARRSNTRFLLRVRAMGYEKGRLRSRKTWREYCKTAMERRIINSELSHIVCKMPNKIKIYRGW